MSTIHDLGYRRYVGTRRPASTRWRVILRASLASAWKTWWRYKAPLILTVIATVTLGIIMYVLQSETFRGLLSAGGAVRVSDALLPMSYGFGLSQIAFFITLTVGASAVAGD